MITYEGDQFCLTDDSTNGVFINGSPAPLGQGVKIALRHGDTLRIGQYEILASLGSASEDPTMADLSVADGYGLADLMATGDGHQNDPLHNDAGPSGGHVGYETFASDEDSSTPQASPRRQDQAWDNDPLRAFEADSIALRARPSASSQAAPLAARPMTRRAATEEDAAGGVANSFAPQTISHPPRKPSQSAPATSPAADFDSGFEDYLQGLEDEFGPPGSGDRAGPNGLCPPTRQAADRGIDAITGAYSTLTPNNHNLWPLLEGLGLTRTPIPNDQIPDFLLNVGLALRQVIDGLHTIYSERNQDGEHTFRVATTQLQPLEDNPIKFAADADEAVELLFGKRHAVHLGPQAAVAECLEGLRLHRSALAEGTAVGLQTVIASFAPDALARRFAKYDPTQDHDRNALWLWGMYEQYFEEVLRNRTHGLTRLFQDVLTQTYDRHIREAPPTRSAGRDQRRDAPLSSAP
jgi:type VI secretion system FHA domain protein